MNTYRMATTPPEPPVRLYKLIALSFLALTIVLLGVVLFMTSKKATITVVAKADKRTVSLVVKVAKDANSKDVVDGVVSSTVFSWTEQFQPTGNKTVSGISKGSAVIYNKSSSAQTLVKTTRLLTAQGVLFHLADKVVVPAEGKVSASIYADQPGAASDIPASQFTIPGLSADRQKQVYAESTEPTQGGESKVGVLSSADIKSAVETYKQKVQDAFRKTLPEVGAGQQIMVAVVNQNAKTDHVSGEEVSGFTVSGTSTLVVVTYNAEYVQRLLDRVGAEKVDQTLEKVLSSDDRVRVSLASYDAKAGTADLAVEKDLMVTLDANVDTLSPQHFLGKKKDEIERYVLGLDHVASVSVVFTPSWMFSAPSVPDRIKVLVKNVE